MKELTSKHQAIYNFAKKNKIVTVKDLAGIAEVNTYYHNADFYFSQLKYSV